MRIKIDKKLLLHWRKIWTFDHKIFRKSICVVTRLKAQFVEFYVKFRCEEKI
jgi:hypothetical protein